ALLAAGSARAQNTCATALPVGLGLHTVDAVNGNLANPYCANSGTATASEWFTFTATTDTVIRVTTYLPGYPTVDTRVHVYTGTCGALACYAGDDDSGPGYSSICNFNVTQGTTYIIAFDNRWTSAGFTFSIEEFVTPPPPPPPVSLFPFTSTSIGINGIAALDMNNDGLDDVAVTNTQIIGGVSYTMSVTIAYQQAGGGFSMQTYPTPQIPNTPSWSLCAGDLDGNGWNDLMLGGGSKVSLLFADADGNGFSTDTTYNQYIFSQRTNMVDINSDGHLDAFVCHDVAANVAFMNNGTGTLTFTQGGFGPTCGNYGSLWTDWDNDGDQDLFIAKCGCDPVDQIMRNNGNGTFTEMNAALGFADSHQSWSSAWGDFDNDGDTDVLVGASSSGYHKLMRNNGDGSFTNITAGSGIDTFNGQSIEWTTHDYDNDGWLDIHGGGAILKNNGDGTFVVSNNVPGNGPVADLNNDGFLDVVNGNTLLVNTPNDNNWMRVRLIGTVSNKSAIGARITITTASGSQIREIRSGDGFRYMSTLYAHFGLGTEEEVTQITIRWPSGIVQIIENPAINTLHTITEEIGTGVAEATESGVNVYPVPATDVLNVTGIAANSPVRVLDAAGRTLLTGNLLNGRINVAALPAGAYVLEATTAEGRVVRTFTKE
ncbi:MAG TPA: FG-GAP-like repeat-containing protein, partial [Flavobacteriales bacterium]|nr:FG-GAP-like repeat-containing protein [Flavobacteriales bacterium]